MARELKKLNHSLALRNCMSPYVVGRSPDESFAFIAPPTARRALDTGVSGGTLVALGEN
jgi:hypothetical protein